MRSLQKVNCMIAGIRHFAVYTGKTEELTDAGTRSLKELPGPKGVPVLGMAHKLAATPLHELLEMERQIYGDLFKIHLGFGNTAVVVSRPDLIEAVCRGEGPHPSRGAALGLLGKATYEVQGSQILVLLEGEEWRRVRTALSQPLVPRKLTSHLPDLNKSVQDLIESFLKEASNSKDGLVHDINEPLSKYTLEGLSGFVFPQKMSFQRNPTATGLKLMRAIQDQNKYFGDTLFFPSWLLPLYTPKSYHKLKEAVVRLYEAGEVLLMDVYNLLQERLERGEKLEEASLMEQWVVNSTLTPPELLTNAANILAGGIDTTANTCTFLLHLLATNPAVQERLHSEVAMAIGEDGAVTAESLQEMPLVKGSVKEAMRMFPIAPLHVRQLSKAQNIDGYHMPAKTTYIMPTWSIGRDAANYEEPLAFRPERWQADKHKMSPFTQLAFGIGPRQCYGRRIAELEMWLLVAKLMQNFQLTTDDSSDLKTVGTILKPTRPINIKLTSRK